MRQLLITMTAVITIVSVNASARAQHAGMPPGMTHEEHLAQMQKDADLKRRGAKAMGFDQDAATHHFALTADGGEIRVSANSADDAATRDQIRAHLKTIAGEFARGEFAKPQATHAETPAGVEGMQRSKDSIHYAYESTPLGGIVRITTSDATALEAIHAFLRYQIAEHKTEPPAGSGRVH